jgi:hypothetical protein
MAEGGGDGALVTVIIKFTSGSGPMSGVVFAGEAETPFAGWMELAGLLESLRTGRSPR